MRSFKKKRFSRSMWHAVTRGVPDRKDIAWYCDNYDANVLFYAFIAIIGFFGLVGTLRLFHTMVAKIHVETTIGIIAVFLALIGIIFLLMVKRAKLKKEKEERRFEEAKLKAKLGV